MLSMMFYQLMACYRLLPPIDLDPVALVADDLDVDEVCGLAEELFDLVFEVFVLAEVPFDCPAV